MTNGPLPDGTFGGYTYDSRNRLTSAGGSGYTYNPDDLRVQITGTGAATCVIDPNATLSRTLMRTKGGVTTYYVYGLGLLYEETGGVAKTYHFDHLGSTIALTNSGTLVSDRVNYSPFGGVTFRSGTSDTPFLSHGELGVMTDANGLISMRARYYNPRLARFISADPIRFEGGLNWYVAFSNNPLSNVDPLGLADWMVGAPYQPWNSFSTIVTNGRDGIDIQLGSRHNILPDVTRTSVLVHEGSHRLDALIFNPAIAVGKLAGLMIVATNKTTAAISEIDASTRQIAYLEKQLQNPNLSAQERKAAEDMKLQALLYRVENYDKLKATGTGSTQFPDASGSQEPVCRK